MFTLLCRLDYSAVDGSSFFEVQLFLTIKYYPCSIGDMFQVVSAWSTGSGWQIKIYWFDDRSFSIYGTGKFAPRCSLRRGGGGLFYVMFYIVLVECFGSFWSRCSVVKWWLLCIKNVILRGFMSTWCTHPAENSYMETQFG